MKVILREVIDSDLPIFFEHQRDPEAVQMAAFPSRDQEAFVTHWAKLRRKPSNIIRTIVGDGQVTGNIGSWIAEDRRLIGYWIGREFWGPVPRARSQHRRRRRGPRDPLQALAPRSMTAWLSMAHALDAGLRLWFIRASLARASDAQCSAIL